ncbi:MAG: VWD domain-containing protein [Actinomycetota bacterium]
MLRVGGVAFIAIAASWLWWSPDASAQQTEITVETTETGDVVFRWSGAEPNYNLHGTAAAAAACNVFPAGEEFVNTTTTITTCSPPVPGSPMCLAVRVLVEGTFTEFSNWHCASPDPLGLGATLTIQPRTFGKVAEGDEVDRFPAGDQACFADLSWQPARYVCVDETDREAATTELTNGTEWTADDDHGGVGDRVVWIGDPDEIVVADFDPVRLVSRVEVREGLIQAVPDPPVPGETLRLLVPIRNYGPATAPSVGFEVTIPAELQDPTVATPGCAFRSRVLHCFLGDISDDEAVFVDFEGLLDENADPDNLVFGFGLTTDSAIGERSLGDPRDGTFRATRPDPIFSVIPPDDRPDSCDTCTTGYWLNEPGVAITFSHPNLATFDGRRYIFHGAGDYVLTESLDDDFAVHVRFSRMNSTTVSFNRAIAATVGDSVISFGDDAASMAWDPSIVRLDGEVITPTASPQALPGGASIAIVNQMFQVDWPDGSYLRVGLRVADPWALFVGQDRWGRVQGMLGNANGDRNDDLVAADGAAFDYNSMELYTIFGASWLLDETTTLFESELLPIDRLPIIPSAVITLADLPPSAVAWADELCRNAGIQEGAGLAECIFDVALTGDPRWITGINIVDDIVAQSISVLADLGLIESDETVTVPTIVDGSIDALGSVDLFRFDLTAGDSVVVNAANNCANRSTFEFALEAPGGYFVGRSSGSQCGLMGIFDVPETGTYILRVYDTGGYIGPYALDIMLPPSETRNYLLDTTVSGSQVPGEDTFYVFEVPEDNTELFYDASTCDLFADLEIYDPSGTVVHSDRCRDDYRWFADAGTWTLRVIADSGRSNNHTFRIWDLPERTVPQALTLDTLVSDSTDFPFDVDTWTFEVAEDGTELFYDNRGCNLFGRIDFIDPSGTTINSDRCGDDYRWFADAGTWTIRHRSNSDDFGGYSFRLWNLPERSVAESLTLDTVVSDSTDFPFDVDTWTFEVAEDGTELFYDNRGCNLFGRIDFIDPSGTTINSDRCGDDYRWFADAGTWTIRHRSNSDDFGSYSFRLWQLPPDPEPVSIALGDLVSGTVSAPFAAVDHTFELAAGDVPRSLTFDSRGCSFFNRVDIIDPGGTAVHSNNCRTDRTFTATTEGTWTVRIRSNNDTFGAFSFVMVDGGAG